MTIESTPRATAAAAEDTATVQDPAAEDTAAVDTAALARRYYTTVDGGDPEATADLFATDGTYDRPGYETLVGPAIREFYLGARVIESGVHTLDEVLVEGRRAAVRGRFDGVLKTGDEAHVGFADFFAFDDVGRISSRTSYFFQPAV